MTRNASKTKRKKVVYDKKRLNKIVDTVEMLKRLASKNPSTMVFNVYIVMAYIGIACIVVCIDMPCIVVADIAVACIFRAYVVMAYIV